jgi:hypothetical protein
VARCRHGGAAAAIRSVDDPAESDVLADRLTFRIGFTWPEMTAKEMT